MLLVYRELDVRLPVERGFVEARKLCSSDAPTHFHHVATERELADAIDSFRGFPQLARELTNGAAVIEYEIVRAIARLLLSPGNRPHVSGHRLMTFDPTLMS